MKHNTLPEWRLEEIRIREESNNRYPKCDGSTGFGIEFEVVKHIEKEQFDSVLFRSYGIRKLKRYSKELQGYIKEMLIKAIEEGPLPVKLWNYKWFSCDLMFSIGTLKNVENYIAYKRMKNKRGYRK